MQRMLFLVVSVALFGIGLVNAGFGAPAGKVRSVQLPPAAFAEMKGIDPERIRAHVRFLSHDLLEGRGTGQRGGDIAAEYIATQFELYGLKPAGDNGTYLQKVPMVGLETQPATTFSVVPDSGDVMSLKRFDDYVATDNSQNAESVVDAPIVYVGYGITAPEYQWDDYKGTDVKGKVLLILVNEPPSEDVKFFKGKALTYYGRWTYKYEEAARHGAIGAILIHKTEMASYPWDVVRNSWSGEKSYLRADGSTQLKVASWITIEGGDQGGAVCGDGCEQDDRGRAVERFPSGAVVSAVEGAHDHEGAPV